MTESGPYRPMPRQAEVLAWVAARWPEYTSVEWRAMKVGEEGGEVLGAVIKASLGLKPRSEIAVESAQTVVCLMALAEAEGFDLWAAVREEWHDMASRTWPDAPPEKTHYVAEADRG